MPSIKFIRLVLSLCYIQFWKLDKIAELLIKILFKSSLEALVYSEILKQCTLKVN